GSVGGGVPAAAPPPQGRGADPGGTVGGRCLPAACCGAIGHRATPSCDLQHSLGHSDRPSGEVRNTRSRLATPPVTDGVASLEVLVRTPACSVHVAHVPLLALEGG